MKIATEVVGVAGANSTVARAFCRLLPDGVIPWTRPLNDLDGPDMATINRFLICTGYLAGKALGAITREEAELSWRRNFLEPARFCDELFARNPNARVCLLGSESGFRGSFDMAYAGAKAALHLYVETKKLEHPGQQLVAIAPTIIRDSAMTEHRDDLEALEARAHELRHGRWLSALEVAEQAYHALFISSPYLSGTVIRLGAGER